MRSLTDRQYERIARYLDGEAVLLTPTELATARDLREAEDSLAGALPVPLQPGLTARVWQRVSARSSSIRRHVRFALYGSAAAAAVVAVLLGAEWFAPAAPHRNRAVVASVRTVQHAGLPVERAERFVPRIRPSLRRPERIADRIEPAAPPVEPVAPAVEPPAPRADLKYADDDRVVAIGRELDRDLYSLETNAVFSGTPTNPIDLTELTDDGTDTRSAPAGEAPRG